MVSKAVPSREGKAKTFYSVREKVNTQAMSRAKWLSFLQELQKINSRDYLIAKIILQGGKRMGEALALTTDMIDYAACEITFKQSKTKGYEKETVINLFFAKGYIVDNNIRQNYMIFFGRDYV